VGGRSLHVVVLAGVVPFVNEFAGECADVDQLAGVVPYGLFEHAVQSVQDTRFAR